jgi:dethiobiotin synthetase
VAQCCSVIYGNVEGAASQGGLPERPSDEPIEQGVHSACPSFDAGGLISLVETAGAVFSPINRDQTNFDLALALEPSIWILVAPDRLGVLHDLTTTLSTMRARGRAPNLVVLSQPDPFDTSVGTNADELDYLGIVSVSGVIPHSGHAPQSLISRIADALLPAT